MKNRRVGVDLIKCDVEGAELSVFKGGFKTLQQDRPVIYTEMLRKWSKKFGYHPNDIIELLADAGYLCFAFVGSRLQTIDVVTDDTMATNFFFFHQSKHKKRIRSLTAPGRTARR
jgi:hypothetical protein